MLRSRPLRHDKGNDDDDVVEAGRDGDEVTLAMLVNLGNAGCGYDVDNAGCDDDDDDDDDDCLGNVIMPLRISIPLWIMSPLFCLRSEAA